MVIRDNLMGWPDSLSTRVNHSSLPKNEGFSGAEISVLKPRKSCENWDARSSYLCVHYSLPL